MMVLFWPFQVEEDTYLQKAERLNSLMNAVTDKVRGVELKSQVRTCWTLESSMISAPQCNRSHYKDLTNELFKIKRLGHDV